MGDKLSKNLSELNSSVKEYVQTKIDLAKITLLSKTTKLSTFLISFWILVTFMCWIIVFITAAFAVWYGLEKNNFVTGLLIASGILCGFCIIFFLVRKQIISNAFIRNYSKILFEEEDE